MAGGGQAFPPTCATNSKTNRNSANPRIKKDLPPPKITFSPQGLEA